MEIAGSVALVTGANRGLGAAFARALLAAGARIVYAGARNPAGSGTPGLVPVRLDITDPDQVAAAARQLRDVTLVVNNAGVFHRAQALDEDVEAALRADFETNVVGTLAVARAFAPVLAGNGGGALVNVLSVASWVSQAGFAAYGASKAASWHLTNSLRLELRPRGTLVVGVHVGYVDTDMAAAVVAPKAAPDEVVASVLAALREDREEVLADDLSRMVKAALAADIGTLYPWPAEPTAVR
jgi:NAD(P)-dependent dehydrogenase (short-subunit alcohol dehydrogenase family)